MEINALKIVEELLLNFAAVIDNILGALVVLLIGWLVASLVAKVVKKLLKGIGIDRLAERLNEIEVIHKSNLKIVPSVLLSKILYYLLFFVFIIAATDVLGMEAVTLLMGNLLNYIPKLLSALVVFVIGILVADFLKKIVLTTCQSLGIPASTTIANVVFYFLFLNVVMITLSQAGIDTEFIQDNISIILAGVVLAFAIGYGFASRQIVANFLSSFYNKEKVRIGDVIGIQGVKGTVIEVDHNSFTLQAEDRRIVVPLSKLSSENVEVFSAAPPPTTNPGGMQ
ncbi:MAG: mechanosensitive ion channel family protein [Saprospiraceae bacterium]